MKSSRGLCQTGEREYLDKDISESDAAKESARVAVVKDTKAVCARLPSVHEQVVQWAHWQAHPLHMMSFQLTAGHQCPTCHFA